MSFSRWFLRARYRFFQWLIGASWPAVEAVERNKRYRGVGNEPATASTKDVSS